MWSLILNVHRRNQAVDEEVSKSLHHAKMRWISPVGRRVSDEEGTDDLELNATLLGFELNVFVDKENILLGESEQESARQVDVEQKVDVDEASRVDLLVRNRRRRLCRLS